MAHNLETHTMRRENMRTPLKHRPRTLIEVLESRKLLAGSGLQGEYFNNSDLTSPAFTRSDATVNFAWQNSAPASSTRFLVRAP